MEKFKDFDCYEDVDYHDYYFDSDMTWEEHYLEMFLGVPILVFMILLLCRTLRFLCSPFLRVRDGCESWANIYFMHFFSIFLLQSSSSLNFCTIFSYPFDFALILILRSTSDSRVMQLEKASKNTSNREGIEEHLETSMK